MTKPHPLLATESVFQRLLNDVQQVRLLWRDEGVRGERVAEAWDLYYRYWRGSQVTFRYNCDNAITLLENPIRQML